MRCRRTARIGAAACPQRMVRADLLEDQVRDYLAGMILPQRYVDAVIEELRSRHANPGADDEAQKIRAQITRWQRLFSLGEIEEAAYRAETAPLRSRLAQIETAATPLDIEEALALLGDVANLWASGTREAQRALIRAVFSRIVV